MLSPSSVVYINGEQIVAADIKSDGERVKLEPRNVEKIKDVIRSYLPDYLPP